MAERDSMERGKRGQHPLGGERLLGEPDTNRVVDSGGNRRQERYERHLRDPTRAEWALLVRQLQHDRHDLFRHVERGGEEVGAEVRVEVMPSRVFNSSSSA